MRTDAYLHHQDDVSASYLELRAVLGELGVPFPVFEEHDPAMERQSPTQPIPEKAGDARPARARGRGAWLQRERRVEDCLDEHAYGPLVGA